MARSRSAEELRPAGDASAAAQHRLDEHRRDVAAGARARARPRPRRRRCRQRRRSRTAPATPRPRGRRRAGRRGRPRRRPRARGPTGGARAHRHDVGLGPELVNRTCSIAGTGRRPPRRSRLGFAGRHRTTNPGRATARTAAATTGRGPEEAGRVVAEEVEVAVAVDVDEVRALGAGGPERERLDVEHRAGVATGQHPRRPARPAPGSPGARPRSGRWARRQRLVEPAHRHHTVGQRLTWRACRRRRR